MTKIKKEHIIGITSLLLFIIVTILVVTNNITSFDTVIYNIVSKLQDYKAIDVFFKGITRIGDTIPTIIIVIVFLFILKKDYKFFLLITELTTIGINQAIKFIIKRPRPPVIERLIEQGGYSYPSGHSMMALCLYGILIYIVYKEIKNKKLKVFLIVLLTTLILLIGLSRIYLRVHYPSDVLGGYLLTLSILMLSITIFNNHFRGNNK